MICDEAGWGTGVGETINAYPILIKGEMIGAFLLLLREQLSLFVAFS